MIERGIFLVLALLISLGSAFVGYTPESFPDSLEQASLCNQQNRSLLCDPSAQLSQGDIKKNYQKINEALSNLRYNTQCKCGAQDTNLGKCNDLGTWGFTVSVAVIDSMILGENEHNKVDVTNAIQEFAVRLRNRLRRGNCDDDAFIVISIKDNAAWTSTGSVAARYLTPELINTITISAEDSFKKQKYTDGLVYMIDSYRKVFNGEKVVTVEDSDWDWPVPKWVVIAGGIVIGLLVIGLLALIVYCVLRCCCCKDRRGNYSTVNRNPQMRL